MARAITKKEAIARMHLGRDVKFKVIEWIKLPENGRMLVIEFRRPDYLQEDMDSVETRYHVYSTEGGGSGGILGKRLEKRK